MHPNVSPAERWAVVFLISMMFVFGPSSAGSLGPPSWSDEFNGPALDTCKWNYDIGNGEGGWGNNELQYYTNRPENVRIENGCLVIEARREPYGGYAFTSGKIQTKCKGDWTYGRFEIRAKLPKGRGVWPAIWMLPRDNAYGPWAASGEIDIMELVGHKPNTVYGTLHYGGEWPANKYTNDSLTLEKSDFSLGFHTFAIEWKPDSLRWFVDSVHYQTQVHGKPFDKPFFLILNVAVGGNWPGSPDGTTFFPQAMYVEYVRVYAGTAAIGTGGTNKKQRAVRVCSRYEYWSALHSGVVGRWRASNHVVLHDLRGRRVLSPFTLLSGQVGMNALNRNIGSAIYIMEIAGSEYPRAAK